MAESNAKSKLLDVLEQEAFKPVLSASEDNVPQNKRDKLKYVKETTARERERFQGYESAEKVYRMYRDDLTSDEAEEVNRDLRDLDLPILADCRDRFERTARDLGVQ